MNTLLDKIFWWRYVFISMVFLLPNLVNATIKLVENFEDPGFSIEKWIVNKNSIASIERRTEAVANKLTTQSHGSKSLFISDPNDFSYVSMYKIFENNAVEYMIEFYILICDNRTAPINSFSLCILWNANAEKKTDITLILDTLGRHDHQFAIHVIDSWGMHEAVAFIDSMNRWYKLQIYRHTNDRNTVVDFYLDGDRKGTYTPMNTNYVSDKIVFGTLSADHFATGELFYDDVSVSTPPIGEHPRLLFKGKTEIDKIRNRKTDTNSTILGKSFKQMSDKLCDYARRWLNNPDVYQVHWESAGAETVWCYYPYAQPKPHNLYTDYIYWNTISRKILWALQTWAFVSFLCPDNALGDSCAAKAESALVSLSSKWRQWTDPQRGTVWTTLDTGYLVLAIALAYDMIFDKLNNYQRMTIENSLRILGLEQLYHNATKSTHGNDPESWPNGYAVQNSALGVGSIVLTPIDSAVVHTVLDRTHAFFNNSIVCDTMGGYVEGISYGSMAIGEFILFCEAYSRNPTCSDPGPYVVDSAYLKQYSYWRLYSLIPGGQQEVNFCDSWALSEWHHFDEVIRLAAVYQDSIIQWYLAKKGDYDPNNASFGYRYRFAPFLWLDDVLGVHTPDVLPHYRYFPNIGWLEFKTGWQNGDCILALRSGHGHTQGNCYNHCHYDVNHFIFGKDNRWLIADAGYGKKYAQWHNVVTLDDDSVQNYHGNGKVNGHYMCTEYNYSYISLDAADCYDNIDKYQREIVFCMDSTPFVVLFDKIVCSDNDPHDINWWLHTFSNTRYDKNESICLFDDQSYLDIRILLPEVTHVSIEDSVLGNSIFRFINVASENSNKAEYLVVLLPHEGKSPSAEMVMGDNLIGARVFNTLVMFCDTTAEIHGCYGGAYEVSINTSLLNIICNFEPNKTYIITSKKESHSDVVTELQTNHIGILSFRFAKTGKWKFFITRAHD